MEGSKGKDRNSFLLDSVVESIYLLDGPVILFTDVGT